MAADVAPEDYDDLLKTAVCTGKQIKLRTRLCSKSTKTNLKKEYDISF